MAAALAGGLIEAGWSGENLLIVEPAESQRRRLREDLGIDALATPGPALSRASVIVWAVKPQVLQAAIQQAVPWLNDPLHISIAAGVTSEAISQWTQSRRVVRVMPNTAALVGAGVSGLAGLEGVAPVDRRLVEQIFSPTGYCFWVESDERLDAVTAVSGSGPAYVFHFMEAFQAAAEATGFDRETARDMILKTVSGAVAQAEATRTEFAVLRQNVTSKRGTTEAALAVLDLQDTAGALRNAVNAAHVRAGELSHELGVQPRG